MFKDRVPCNKKSVKSVPSTTGVYVFVRETRPIYIGKSINLRARLKSHFENAKLNAKERALTNAEQIEYLVTDSEFKAILLESKLIQKLKPLYNVRWRDDKSYLYIKVTIQDVYPKILVTRKENDGKSIYFGPFSSIRIIKSILKEVRKTIPYCSQNKLSKARCFYSKINLCNPCPNQIENITDITLKNRQHTLYKTNIKLIIKILNGKIEIIQNTLYSQLNKLKISQDYEKAIVLRDRIINFERLVNNKKFNEDLISEYNQSPKRLLSLSDLLHPYFSIKYFQRIECFDMSTLGFQDSTASMVVFTDGMSDKQEYKRFRLKKSNVSDVHMFSEVFVRRFKHNWPKSDLIILDGGKPQVRMGLSVLKKLSVNIPIIGIAKKPDRIIIGKLDMPTLRPQSSDPGFILVKEMRDEAHRFARKYHLFLRYKKMV